VDSSTFTDPVHTYGRSDGEAVNGGVIYRRPATGETRFPPEYDGDILYTDFYSGWVRRLKKTGAAWGPAPAPGQPNATDWAIGGGWIADWLAAPDGSLWYCRMLSGDGSGPGQIRRIRYTGLLSVPPDTMARIEFRAPFPSPSNGLVSFDFTLPAEARVELAIYDAGGRRVRGVFGPDALPPGARRLVWDAQDGAGRVAGAGIYLAVLTVGGQRLERRFALVR
jgi:hypothetical protein